jgi:asparagine synthase (glutamine-hydrolysing)
MSAPLAHRGPDDEACYVDGPVALGHRRLAVIDLTESGRQPMSNEDGTLWLVFNGEIYNFRELRQKLEPRHRFKGTSDSEVILHLYEERGDEAVAALDGMFAFALWDSGRRRLLLARDRSGKKPLFYHAAPGFLAFASEVKALLQHPDVPHCPDPAALPLYLTHGYVPNPATFYEGIRALPPAHFMVATEANVSAPCRYWRVGFRDGAVRDEHDAQDRLRSLLRAAVERRLVADVPLGAFLSGGLDSSSIVAMMADAAAGRVKTFTIGFRGGLDYDERLHARAVAEHFGTDHTEFVVEPRALDLIDRLVWHHDGPFGDASAIPTYLLCELTRRHVTVALNGDGGDEVFAGYLRFYSGIVSERIPRGLFSLATGLVGFLPEPKDRRHPFRFVKRFAEAGSLSLPERYLRWNSYFTTGLVDLLRPELHPFSQPERILESYRPMLDATPFAEESASTLARLLQLNFETYLPDDLNVKMDRMSMAHALETRSPFLDTALVEFGASLPDDLRMRLGRGKVLLRRAMKGLLPEPILRRGKRGFGPPLGAWFRDELDTFLSERLLESSSPIYEYLRPESVARLVATHRRAAADLSPQIWSLLTLESWLRQERGWGRHTDAPG